MTGASNNNDGDRLAFLSGGGVTAACARALDWAQTPLGPIESWPLSLRTILGVLFHSRHPMFLFWGPELIQFYNDAYLPSFGTGKHPTAMGQRARECWPELWPFIGPQLDDVMLRGLSTWHEDHLVPNFRNGKVEDVYWTYGYSPVFDESGRVGGTFVCCTETTVRVVAERRLSAECLLAERVSAPAEAFAAMTADVPFAVVLSVEAGHRRVASSTGLDDAELVRAMAQFAALEIPPGGGELIRGLIERDGVALDVFVATLAPRGQAEPAGCVAFGINSKLPFDAAYREHLQRLATLIANERSQSMYRGQEEKTRHQLMVADRMMCVGTLASGMAHEINNPLTFVTANLDLALEEVRDLAGGSPSSRLRELEDMLMEAHAGAERVGKIVRGMKTFARTGDERRDVIDLRPVLELSVSMAFHEIRHRARLVKDYGPTPKVDADDARLGQVFINLLVNAAHAIPPGAVDANEIRISTSTDAIGRAVVEIRDSGPGIAPAVLARMFEPFFTTKGVGIGTGLGLSICHNLVAELGGEITVATEEMRGTTFRIALPPARPRVTTAAGTSPSERRAAVLIVDDELPIRIVLSRALRDHDLTVLTRVDDALAALSSGAHFDIILSDLMMPVSSGMELYEEVRRRDPAMAERMVFVTGGASTPAAREFLRRIPNERIEKPFTAKAMRELVQRFIQPGAGRCAS